MTTWHSYKIWFNWNDPNETISLAFWEFCIFSTSWIQTASHQHLATNKSFWNASSGDEVSLQAAKHSRAVKTPTSREGTEENSTLSFDSGEDSGGLKLINKEMITLCWSLHYFHMPSVSCALLKDTLTQLILEWSTKFVFLFVGPEFSYRLSTLLDDKKWIISGSKRALSGYCSGNINRLFFN